MDEGAKVVTSRLAFSWVVRMADVRWLPNGDRFRIHSDRTSSKSYMESLVKRSSNPGIVKRGQDRMSNVARDKGAKGVPVV